MAGYLSLLIALIVMSNLTLGYFNLAYSADDGLASAESRTLWSELKRVSAEHGILIEGLEKTRTSPARPAQGSLREQLQSLLFDFNYVLIQSPHGGVKQVFILNQKGAILETPKRIVLNTTRSGSHHLIQVT